MIVFLTNLMHKFFILISLLHSSTCFEHYCAHIQEDNCINTASGIVTLCRVTVQYTGCESIYYIPLHVSSTIMLIFSRTIVLVQPLVSSLCMGDRSIHRLRVLS